MKETHSGILANSTDELRQRSGQFQHRSGGSLSQRVRERQSGACDVEAKKTQTLRRNTKEGM